jgi:elongation factor Ts
MSTEVSIDQIKQLREKCGAGVMDCRKALTQTGGDMEKAAQILKEKALLQVAKKSERVARKGLVETYVHTGGSIGSMVEVNCETDFVARTKEFKELAHNIAMQVAAICPQYISPQDVPQGTEIEPETGCLLSQAFIKDPTKSVQDIINETIAKVGENIKVSRFIRYELSG